MRSLRLMRDQWILLLGDGVVLGLVTIFGFASHETLSTAGARMLTTFLPLVAAWLLVAPWLGVFDPHRAANLGDLWRPFLAMILAAPLAAFIRALILGVLIQPIFVVVIGGVSALTLVLWRLIYWFIRSRRKDAHG